MHSTTAFLRLSIDIRSSYGKTSHRGHLLSPMTIMHGLDSFNYMFEGVGDDYSLDSFECFDCVCVNWTVS